MDFLVLLAILAFIVFYFKRKFDKIAASVAHIPGPAPLPFIGNAMIFIGKHPTQYMKIGTDFVKTYGLFNRILLGPKILISVGDPEDVETLLVSMKTLEKSEEYDYARAWIGDGLITSTGPKWHSRRKVITPAFHFNILQSFAKIFDDNSDVFVEKLRAFESLDIYPLTALCALDNICESAMGQKIDAQSNEDSAYVKAVEEITSIIAKRQFLLPLRNDFIFKCSGYHGRQQKLLKVLHGFTDNVILTRREELKKRLKNDDETKEKPALIDILLQSTINGQPLTNMDIREEVDTFMFAGHDTTTSGIGFCLYCLAKYPEIQQKAFDEIRNVIGDDLKEDVTLKLLNELSYLELVIKENLRLFPSVPVIGRKMRDDTILNGKLLPKGANVLVSALIMGQSDKIWNEPLKFIPERFELDNLTTMNPFAYLPFSAGPRNCIGQKFAMLEMKSVVSKVLRHFEISLEPGFEVVIKAEVVLKPYNGIKLKLKARHYE